MYQAYSERTAYTSQQVSMNFNSIYFIVFYLLVSNFLFAQTPDIKFKNLNKEDGLSHSLVVSIVQDDLGFIWIGTQDGLNRYDGYDFKVFRPTDLPNSIRHQWIRTLYKDRQGKIWIRFQIGGLSVYDPKTELFQDFLHDPADPTSISSDKIDNHMRKDQIFHEDVEGNLWIATSKGLNKFNRAKNNFERIIFNDLSNELKQPLISSITSTSSGLLVVGTQSGFISYNPLTQKSHLLPLKYDVYATAVYCDANDVIWAGLEGEGLYRIELSEDGVSNSITSIRLADNSSVMNILEDDQQRLWLGTSKGLYLIKDKSNLQAVSRIGEKIIGETVISHFEQDKQGRIWASSSKVNGLWLIDTQTLSIRVFNHSKNNRNSIGPNKTQTTFIDSKGVLWMGHEKGGVTKVNLMNNQFLHLNNSVSETDQMPNNDVYAIYVDTLDNLWVGTQDRFYKKNRRTGAQTVFEPEEWQIGHYSTRSNQPSGKLVGVIEPALDGDLWLGYFDYKVSKLNPKTNQFKNYQLFPTRDDAFRIWSMRAILSASDSTVYFGGANQGLCQLSPLTDKFSYYPISRQSDGMTDNWIYSLYEDEDGMIWVGTANSGLLRFDPTTETFTAYRHDSTNKESISNNTVRCIARSNTTTENLLWIGTEKGLNLFHPVTKVFKTFTEQDGLPSNVINGLLTDERGRLWFSTNGGISCLELNPYKITNYSVEDGLQDNEFNEGSYFKDHKGKMYFGGVNGITVFHPDSLRPNPYMPELVFTELKINNQTIESGQSVSGRVLLDNAISYTDKLTLTPKDKVVSFTFSALHFANSSKIKYRYRLSPYQSDWTEVNSDKRYADYTNIPAGNYQLQIECTDLEGQWKGDYKVLEIEVLPPFWKTLWFSSLAAVLLFLMILLSIQARTKSLKNQKVSLSRQVDRATQELKRKNSQLKQTYEVLKSKQSEVIIQNKKIAEQRDLLETDNQELEQQKKEIMWMAEQLHESDQSKLDFFTNISHELRTPLSLIIGPTKNLLDQTDYSDSATVKESLSLMYRNEKRLLRLINQLLEVQKVESSTLKLATKTLDILQFCSSLLELFQPLSAARHIELNFDCPYPELPASFDPDKLEKILFNLLSNAFKHTPEGGTITLRLRKKDSAKQVTISVINSGESIKKADLARIFDRFFYVNKKNCSGELSSGIGLSLVKNLVHIHGGNISVELTQEGTNFLVELPIIPNRTKLDITTNELSSFSFAKSMIEDVKELEQLTVPMTGKTTATAKNMPTLLLIEDNPDMRLFLSRGLRETYQVITAEDGEMGIKTAFKYIPDIIISDVMMPKMDGIELTRQLKNDERTSHIPILLLTAKVNRSSQILGLKSGANDYLTKPFDLQILKLKLKNLLDSRVQFLKSVQEQLPAVPKHVDIDEIDQGLLSKIVGVVEKHIDNDKFNGDILAKEVGMSKGSLYRKLKGLTGMTVNIFIRTYRLKVAANLLTKGNYSISEISYAVGFDNPKYFSVCFKQLFKKTPREYMQHGDFVEL